jgi:predicted DNA-binding transcriptional regulator YafY
VEEVTIHRNLNELRRLGIHINSRKKTIDVELEKMDSELLVQIVAEYCVKKLGTDIFLNKIKVLLDSVGNKASAYLTLLSKSIKEQKEVEIQYKKLSDNKTNSYTIQPIEIVNNEYNWILIANHNEMVKSFFINRIKSLKLTDRKFQYKSNKSDSDAETIKLRFNPAVEQQVIGKI